MRKVDSSGPLRLPLPPPLSLPRGHLAPPRDRPARKLEARRATSAARAAGDHPGLLASLGTCRTAHARELQIGGGQDTRLGSLSWVGEETYWARSDVGVAEKLGAR